MLSVAAKAEQKKKKKLTETKGEYTAYTDGNFREKCTRQAGEFHQHTL